MKCFSWDFGKPNSSTALRCLQLKQEQMYTFWNLCISLPTQGKLEGSGSLVETLTLSLHGAPASCHTTAMALAPSPSLHPHDTFPPAAKSTQTELESGLWTARSLRLQEAQHSCQSVRARHRPGPSTHDWLFVPGHLFNKGKRNPPQNAVFLSLQTFKCRLHRLIQA